MKSMGVRNIKKNPENNRFNPIKAFFNKALEKGKEAATKAELFSKQNWRAIALATAITGFAIAPNVSFGDEMVNVEYKNRKVYVLEDHDRDPFSTDSLFWVYAKDNGTGDFEAINDTTYSVIVGDVNYHCGDIRDTIYTPDSSDVFTYLQRAHIGVTYGEITDTWPEASMRGDSTETCTKWVETRTDEYFNADGGWSLTNTSLAFHQVYSDGSVHNWGPGGIGYNRDGHTFSRSYRSDSEVSIITLLGVDESKQTEENKPTKMEAKIYPNPFNSNLNISFNEEISGRLEIYDASGRRVFTKNLKNEKEVNVNPDDWNSGVYLMLVETNNGQLFQGTATLIK